MKRTGASRALVVGVSLAAALLSSQADAAPKELGLNVHQSVDVGLDATAAIGSTWVRMDFNWFQAEASQGNIDFTLYDQIVDNARSRGLNVLAVIGYTPAWASSGNGDGADTLNDVPVAGAYEAFVQTAVQHFQGRVTHWELWNEPNLETFFEGTPQQYVDLILKPGADVVHGSCADCVVVAPGLATVGGEWDVWMQTVFTQVPERVDIVSGHVYSGFPQDDPSAGESAPSFYSKLENHRVKKIGETVVYEDPLSLRECMVKYGVGSKPFWMTETGDQATYGDATEMLAQASYVRHVLEAMLSRPWWTTTIFYEAFDEPNTGYEWGFVLHDPSASEGYRCKTVCDVVRQATSEQPAFGGAGADCSDGLDNEGDGLIDYPADLDCEAATSGSEGAPPADAGVPDADAGEIPGGDDGGGVGAQGDAGGEASGCACRAGSTRDDAWAGMMTMAAAAAMAASWRRLRGCRSGKGSSVGGEPRGRAVLNRR